MDGLLIRRQHVGSQRMQHGPAATGCPMPSSGCPAVRCSSPAPNSARCGPLSCCLRPGDQLAQVTIGFVVYTKTGSPFLAALAYALTYLPSLMGGPALAGAGRRLSRPSS